MKASKVVVVFLLIVTLPFTVPSALVLAAPLDYEDAPSDSSLDFTWRYSTDHYEVHIPYPSDILRMYEDLPVIRWGLDYAVAFRFITLDDPVLKELAAELDDLSDGMDQYRKADFILSFVCHNIFYVSDDGLLDHYQFPLETLCYGHGDCEDFAFLLVTLYRLCGFDAVLVSSSEHMGSAVHLDDSSSYNLPYITAYGSDIRYYVSEGTSSDHVGYHSYPQPYVVFHDSYVYSIILIAIIIVIVLFVGNLCSMHELRIFRIGNALRIRNRRRSFSLKAQRMPKLSILRRS